MKENNEYNSKDELIRRIISEEYRMFSEVQNIGGRASCQDDFDTFYIMRSLRRTRWKAICRISWTRRRRNGI